MAGFLSYSQCHQEILWAFRLLGECLQRVKETDGVMLGARGTVEGALLLLLLHRHRADTAAHTDKQIIRFILLKQLAIGIFYLIVSSFTGLKSRNGLSLTIDLFIQGNSLESVAPTAPGRYTPLLNILLSATTLYIFT